MAYPTALTRAPRHPLVVDRARLIEQVDGPEPCVVIMGPSGSGKSVLAAQMASRRDHRLVWCRLDSRRDRAHDLLGLASAAAGAPVDPTETDLLALADDLLEVLLEAEPWKKDHYDALAAMHRERGDEAAASAVERRWFEDE